MTIQQEIYRDVTATALKVSPGVAASAFTMDSIVVLLTIVFLVLQIAYLAWTWGRKLFRRRKAPPPVCRQPEDE